MRDLLNPKSASSQTISKAPLESTAAPGRATAHLQGNWSWIVNGREREREDKTGGTLPGYYERTKAEKSNN